ncbi:MAG TPA: hypothetical protein VEW08_05130, partial [Steroidobacteraceae bacterium]|nr:hypothetical protein [Steroidobacteraceae bacterium]
MESFSVRTTLTQQDWHAYLAAANIRIANAKRADASLLMRVAPTAMLFTVIAVVVFMLLFKPPLLKPEG